MNSIRNMRELEKVCKAVANKRRLAILALLNSKGELTVGDIATHIKLSFTSASKHVLLMERAGLLDKDQRGLKVYYKVANGFPLELKSLLAHM